jgi:hypothetical protein
MLQNILFGLLTTFHFIKFSPITLIEVFISIVLSNFGSYSLGLTKVYNLELVKQSAILPEWGKSCSVCAGAYLATATSPIDVNVLSGLVKSLEWCLALYVRDPEDISRWRTPA